MPVAAEYSTNKGRRNGTVATPYTVETVRTARHGRKRWRPPRPLLTKHPKPMVPPSKSAVTNQAIRPKAETNTALTPKQTAFCQEYMVDLNGTQAAIRAGYSKRTANEQASQQLAKLNVRTEVNRLLDERAQRVQVDADFVVRALVENVLRSMQAVPIRDAEGNSIGEYRYNGAVANKALELLGRHLRMFTDKHEVEHSQRLDAMQVAQLLAQAEKRTCVIDSGYIERVANGRDP